MHLVGRSLLLIPVLLWAGCGPGDGADSAAPADADTDVDADADTDADTDTDTYVPPCDADAGVAAGVGEFELLLLDGGEEVHMTHGPQGGWHLDTGALVTGTGEIIQVIPSLWWVAGDASLAGEGQLPETIALARYDEDICSGETIAIRAFIDDYLPQEQTQIAFICSLDGQEVELTVHVTDVLSGKVGEGSARFILRIDPNDIDNCS